MGDTQQQQDQGEQQASGQPETLKTYLTKDMVTTTLFVMRFCTILGTFVFLLSSLGLLTDMGHWAYTNAMITSFFTFSIRLYQRKLERQIYIFSKEMYQLMVMEDAGHYMLYTFFYYNQLPLSIYLIPPFLYAIMFSVKFTNGLIPFLPGFLQSGMQKLNSRIARGQVELRRFIAYTEIFLLLVVVWNVLSGYMFILAPFIQYQFIRLRYQSVRNNSVMLVFSELRQGAEFLSRHPQCPPVVSSVIQRAIAFVCSLAPTQPMRREA